MDHEERISLGREASIVKALIEPLITERVNGILLKMVAEYRSGAPKFDALLGKTAEISALMSLMENLESTERQGTLSMEKEYAQSST